MGSSVSSETFAQRNYFYVGGSYVDDGTGTGNDFMVGQAYVERLWPQGGVRQQYSLIFIHGGAQTGTNWLNTPDYRQGWASWFLNRGYRVYIFEQPSRGRSPSRPGDASLKVWNPQYVEKYITATRDFQLWPQATLHTQWPGTGRKGDPTFDDFYASQVPSQLHPPTSEASTVNALAKLLPLSGPSILVAHSQSGPYVLAAAASQPPDLIAGLVLLEPAGPPFHEAITRPGHARPWGISNTPIPYFPAVTIDPTANVPTNLPTATLSVAETAPDRIGMGLTTYMMQAEPAKQLPRLEEMPILVVTSESGYHSCYDWVTVKYLRQAGCKQVKHLELAKEGIRGNGHLMFMEKNNLEVAALVEGWIRSLSKNTTQ